MMRNVGFILMAVLFLVVVAAARSLEKRETHIPDGSFVPQKRPFCNAFTGCGRKRSENSMMSLSGENDATLGRISNRIMAEARLWEMLQQRLAEAAGIGDFTNELSQNVPLNDLLTSRRRKRSAQGVSEQA